MAKANKGGVLYDAVKAAEWELDAARYDREQEIQHGGSDSQESRRRVLAARKAYDVAAHAYRQHVSSCMDGL